ncbi:hypothetical protein ACFL2V_10930, partial [Pseudomonadota bacterium]
RSFWVEKQRLTEEVTISTKNHGNRRLENVDIFYKCGDSGCYIGTTDSDGLLKEKLPLCVNGFLVPHKEDYIGSPTMITTFEDKSDSVLLKLSKVKEFDLDAKKLIFTKEETGMGLKWAHKSLSSFQPDIKLIEDDEDIFFQFTRISQDDEKFESPAMLKGSSLSSSKIRLAPGNYEVKAQLIKNSELYIPESSGIFGIGKMNETTLSTGQYGGLVLNEATGLFKLSENDFENSDTIMMYTIYFDLFSLDEKDRKHVDLSIINDIEMLSSKYRTQLKPILR